MKFSLLKREEKNIFCILMTAIFVWFVINFFWGERIQAGNGFGWDGVLYADIARRFGAYIHDKLFSLYYVQRIFPSLIVHIVAKIFRISLSTPANIIHVFYLYNTIVILIGIYVLYRIAKLQTWTFPVFLIGFSALFLNYPILKLMPYYPVLTDYTALTLGLLMLYFYLIDTLFGLLIVTFIGAFTFPTILYCGAILLLFQNKAALQKNFINFTLKVPINRWCLALSFSIFIAVITLYFLGTIHPSQFTAKFSAMLMSGFSMTPHLLSPWVGITSFLAVAAFMFFMILPFIKEQMLIRINLIRLCLVALLFCLVRLIQMHLSNGKLGPLTVYGFIKIIMLESVAHPLIFLVSHFIYYGPFILLSVLYWKEMVVTAQTKGLGLTLFLLMYAVLAVGSESRQFINAVPLFVFLLCEVFAKVKVTLNFSGCILALSLIISKCWMPINILSWQGGSNDYLQFPYQMLFMNFGPEMGNKMYLVQFLVMAVVFYGLWSWKRNIQFSFSEANNLILLDHKK